MIIKFLLIMAGSITYEVIMSACEAYLTYRMTFLYVQVSFYIKP